MATAGRSKLTLITIRRRGLNPAALSPLSLGLFLFDHFRGGLEVFERKAVTPLHFVPAVQKRARADGDPHMPPGFGLRRWRSHLCPPPDALASVLLRWCFGGASVVLRSRAKEHRSCSAPAPELDAEKLMKVSDVTQFVDNLASNCATNRKCFWLRFSP
jgi:hypothetical protein